MGIVVLLAGKKVLINSITELIFGEDYDSVTTIDSGLFEGWSELVRLRLPSNITTIVASSLISSHNIIDFDLPSKIQSIGEDSLRLKGKRVRRGVCS